MASPVYKKKVAFSVTNCICHDQRVLKMAGSVSAFNCEITIIGRKRGKCCDSDLVPFKTRRFRMLFKRGFLFYKFFNIRLFFYLLFHRFNLLVANDLDTLLPNFLVSRLKHLPLVYDSHEYFTGVPELRYRPFVRFVWKSIEKMIFPKLEYVITVSEPIADIYESLYGIRPLVIRNLSNNSDHIMPFRRSELGVDEDDLLLIIQGTGINIDKGAEELVDAVNIIPGVTLLIVGAGDVIPRLKKQVEELDLGHRVRFVPTVNWETLMRYTRSADIGMCLEKDTNLNYRYSLPNKLFDYITAGIPVIASDLPETRKILIENNCGTIIESVTQANIGNALKELKNNKILLHELRKNSALASKKLNWDTESKKVLELYKRFL